MDTSNLVSSFTKVADLTSKISGLKVIDSGTIDSKFKSIKDVFAKLRNFKLDSYKGDISSLDSYKKITEAINKISGFVSDLAGTNIVDISGKLEQLKNTVEQLSKFKIVILKKSIFHICIQFFLDFSLLLKGYTIH